MSRLSTEGIPECTSCGTCCFSTHLDYIRVFGCDRDRMDDRARAYTEGGVRMRMENGRCAALRIDPVAGRFLCSIYEMRPDVCRSLERGSGGCRADRRDKAERPLIAIEALRRRPV